MNPSPWYATWFDTPYYHMLYRHRDETEARSFLTELVHTAGLTKDCSVLDLACGRGRHAITLHQLGFDVTGYDLSASSIAFAKQWEQPGLRFAVQDMLLPYAKEQFDVVMNLFTSFGYFETEEEHALAIQHMAHALKPGGRVILDFMNAQKVMDGLVPEEVVEVGEIEFHITRHADGNSIVKRISFEHLGQLYQFEERVRAFLLEDFTSFFEQAGLLTTHIWGSASGTTFDSHQSARLIIIAHKP
jgi:SAM-dependent methyltransferase